MRAGNIVHCALNRLQRTLETVKNEAEALALVSRHPVREAPVDSCELAMSTQTTDVGLASMHNSPPRPKSPHEKQYCAHVSPTSTCGLPTKLCVTAIEVGSNPGARLHSALVASSHRRAYLPSSLGATLGAGTP